MNSDHDLYIRTDKDCPESIKDSNGDVVLALCKRCHGGEIELQHSCAARLAEQLQAAQAEIERLKVDNTYHIESVRAVGKAAIESVTEVQAERDAARDDLATARLQRDAALTRMDETAKLRDQALAKVGEMRQTIEAWEKAHIPQLQQRYTAAAHLEERLHQAEQRAAAQAELKKAIEDSTKTAGDLLVMAHSHDRTAEHEATIRREIGWEHARLLEEARNRAAAAEAKCAELEKTNEMYRITMQAAPNVAAVHIQSLQEKLTAVEAELADHAKKLAAVVLEVAAAQDQSAARLATLKKYGRHADTCEFGRILVKGETEKPKCICGLAQALAGEGEA